MVKQPVPQPDDPRAAPIVALRRFMMLPVDKKAERELIARLERER